MPFFEGFRIALIAIWSHKMRAVLTTLGVLIGVATVIMMLSIVHGIDKQALDELNSIGANVFYITKFPALTISMNWRKMASRDDLDIDDAKAILRRCPSVQDVSPYLFSNGMQVKRGGRETDSSVFVVGGTETFLEAGTDSLGEGRFFSKTEVDRARNVIILGVDVVNELFPFTDPIGQTVRLEGHKYQVIGILEEKGSMWGQSQDNRAIIPLPLFERQIAGGHDQENFTIAIKARPDYPLAKAIEQARVAMRISRGLKTFEEDDFAIETRDSITAAYSNITGAIFAAAIGIAFISLLVGGIGIMNIMLVSVTERTREIGVRKSMGARRRDILMQFLIEAITVSSIGGVLGITIGVAALAGVGALIDDLPIALTLQTVMLGFFFSVGTGILFGVLPARRAARLDPIECLRYE